VDSQTTSKGATKETRERAERVSVVSGSARATVVAEEDTPSPTTRERLSDDAHHDAGAHHSEDLNATIKLSARVLEAQALLDALVRD
jgi:hypothetical protein